MRHEADILRSSTVHRYVVIHTHYLIMNTITATLDAIRKAPIFHKNKCTTKLYNDVLGSEIISLTSTGLVQLTLIRAKKTYLNIN
jgi:hypothetical protein